MIAPDAHVLVIITARIGDTLLATPAMRAIRNACPQGSLTCMAHPGRLPVLENLPFIDQLRPITKFTAKLRGWLNGKRWDYAFVYGHDSALIHYALRTAKRVIAFQQAQPELKRCLYHAVTPPTTPTHAVEERLLLVRAAGIEATDLRLAYQPTPQEIASAKAWLDAHLPQGATCLIGLQLASFSTKSYRNWPIENFIALGEKILSSTPGTYLLLLGSKEDRHTASLVEARFSDTSSNLAGLFTLREMAAIMYHLNLYIGVDTGPTHLAGALGIPMVAMYHCRHRGKYLAPLNHGNILHVIEHPSSDADCSTGIGMDAISVAMVWEKVHDTLQHVTTAKSQVGSSVMQASGSF